MPLLRVLGFLLALLLGLGMVAAGGHRDAVPPLPETEGDACRMFSSVPGPLQSV